MLRGVGVNDYYANATKLKTISSLILTSMGTPFMIVFVEYIFARYVV